MVKPFKAWMVGNTIIVISYCAYLIFDLPALFMWFVVPTIAAFTTAFLAYEHKIFVGMSMAATKAFFTILIAFFCMIFGVGDNIGVGGILLLTIIGFIIDIILCLFASVFANFITNCNNKNRNE